MRAKGGMIKDKRGRWIGIHDRPGAWKISAYQRDEVYQRYLSDRVATSPHRNTWVKEAAKSMGISVDRLEAILREGAEPGWDWWVGCSLPR